MFGKTENSRYENNKFRCIKDVVVSSIEAIKAIFISVIKKLTSFLSFTSKSVQMNTPLASRKETPKIETSYEIKPEDNHSMDFSPDETEVILSIVEQFKKHPVINSNLKIENVTRIDPSLHNWIFEIENISGVIFKMGLQKDGLKNRLEAINFGQNVCKDFNLDLLKIPEPKVLIENTLYAERKYRFIKDPSEIGNVYSKELLSKILSQLVTFICKTGASDLTPQNLGLLSDGSGICLYDLEDKYPEDPSFGLKTFITGCYGNYGSGFFEQTKAIIKDIVPDTFKKLFPAEK